MEGIGKIITLFSSAAAPSQKEEKKPTKDVEEKIGKVSEEAIDASRAEGKQEEKFITAKVVEQPSPILTSFKEAVKGIGLRTSIDKWGDAKSNIPLLEQFDFTWITRLADLFEIKLSSEVIAWISLQRQNPDSTKLKEDSETAFSSILDKSSFTQYLKQIERMSLEYNFEWVKLFESKYKIVASHSLELYLAELSSTMSQKEYQTLSKQLYNAIIEEKGFNNKAMGPAQTLQLLLTSQPDLNAFEKQLLKSKSPILQFLASEQKLSLEEWHVLLQTMTETQLEEFGGRLKAHLASLPLQERELVEKQFARAVESCSPESRFKFFMAQLKRQSHLASFGWLIELHAIYKAPIHPHTLDWINRQRYYFTPEQLKKNSLHLRTVVTSEEKFKVWCENIILDERLKNFGWLEELLPRIEKQETREKISRWIKEARLHRFTRSDAAALSEQLYFSIRGDEAEKIVKAHDLQLQNSDALHSYETRFKKGKLHQALPPPEKIGSYYCRKMEELREIFESALLESTPFVNILPELIKKQIITTENLSSWTEKALDALEQEGKLKSIYPDLFLKKLQKDGRVNAERLHPYFENVPGKPFWSKIEQEVLKSLLSVMEKELKNFFTVYSNVQSAVSEERAENLHWATMKQVTAVLGSSFPSLIGPALSNEIQQSIKLYVREMLTSGLAESTIVKLIKDIETEEKNREIYQKRIDNIIPQVAEVFVIPLIQKKIERKMIKKGSPAVARKMALESLSNATPVIIAALKKAVSHVLNVNAPQVLKTATSSVSSALETYNQIQRKISNRLVGASADERNLHVLRAYAESDQLHPALLTPNEWALAYTQKLTQLFQIYASAQKKAQQGPPEDQELALLLELYQSQFFHPKDVFKMLNAFDKYLESHGGSKEWSFILMHLEEKSGAIDLRKLSTLHLNEVQKRLVLLFAQHAIAPLDAFFQNAKKRDCINWTAKMPSNIDPQFSPQWYAIMNLSQHSQLFPSGLETQLHKYLQQAKNSKLRAYLYKSLDQIVDSLIESGPVRSAIKSLDPVKKAIVSLIVKKLLNNPDFTYLLFAKMNESPVLYI